MSYYIGIDIGGTNLKAGLVDEAGRLLATRKMKVAGIADPAALAWTIHALGTDLCRDFGCDPAEIFSVGVGCPGAVEIRGGSILYTCNLPLRNVPLRRLFHQLSETPLYIENDANCAALAEYYVGGGIVHNGKIFHGSNGMAGEVGHMSIEMDGEACPCGRRGCWEQYASAAALKRQTAQALAAHPDSILAQVIAENDGHVSGQSAFIAARRGCPVGQAVCDRYIRYLTTGIVNIINIFQPDTLAIGGGVSNEADEQLLLPLRRQVAAHSLPCNYDKMTRIVKAELGNNAGVIGAALLGKKKRVI